MENKEKNFVSAVIYVHNAEGRIKHFLETVIDVMQDNFEHSEIICVNDSSDDESLSQIKEVGQAIDTTSVSILNMSYFHGSELSMNAGMDMSIGDFVFEFDNTYLDFDPSVIMDIYHYSLKGYDIVSASPDKKEKTTSKLFYKIFNKFSEVPYEMSTESFRILSRRVINRISSMNKTIFYRKAVYANCGLKTANTKYPVVSSDRDSVDKREKHYRSALAVDALILFTGLGYRISMAMTLIMMIMSIFMVIYSVAIYATSHPVAGWTTTIFFLSIAFFGLFGVMTMIIKYLQLLVKLVFKRKHYNFDSIEKLSR